MTTDDMELLRQYVANQSESAFSALVSRHSNLVYSAALRRVGNPQLAEEIMQAVFIILARKAGSFNEKTILPSWLYRTACYVSGHAFKQELHRQQREQKAYMQSLSNKTGSELWPQIMPLLEEGMLQLGQTDRDALVLRFFEERSLKEVGTALGASEEAAKKRVNRALEKLRAIFVKQGVTSTTATLAGAISANSVQAAPAALIKTTTAVALTKGATASTSTLTLIKGALKIMAWTKMKTAIVTSAVVLFAAASVTPYIWTYHLSPKAWRNRFEAAYQLKNGETVRYVKPPYISERMEYWRWKDPEMAAITRGQPTYIIFRQDAEEGLYRDTVGGGSSQTLKSLLHSGLFFKQYELDGPDELMSLSVHGDWVIRAGATREACLAGLEPVLKKITGHDIRFEKQTVERDVIIVHGHLVTPGKSPIHIYIENANDKGFQSGGRFNAFFDEVGDELNIRLINETQEGQTNEIGRFSWEYHHDARQLPQNDGRQMELIDKIFNNIANQTGLTFTRERRTVDVWLVTEQK